VLEFVLPKTVLLLPPVVNTSHNICCWQPTIITLEQEWLIVSPHFLA
jgi:hypothetical protein